MIKQPPLIINTSCFDFRTIRPSRDDVLTRGTKEQIIGNNETWDRNCAPQEQEDGNDQVRAD